MIKTKNSNTKRKKLKNQMMFFVFLLICILIISPISSKVYASEGGGGNDVAHTVSNLVLEILNGIFGVLLKIQIFVPYIMVLAIYLTVSVLLFAMGNGNFLASPRRSFL